ncbi:MAG: hypothetical protein DMG04_24770 [Acidobacteria bacterium]|nr:MAG: hypothetical protein DMG04_24770 [Acidobacteriota bacterium]
MAAAATGPVKSPRDDEIEDGDPREGRMGFLEHLDELRTRIIRSCIAIAAGMAVAFFFVDRIADFVLAPTIRALPDGATLVFLRPGEGFSFDLDIALIGGLILAAPFVTYQVWRFVAPGLYAREKKFVVPIVLLAAVGTLAGAAFSHYVLYPAMMAFFRSFDSPRIRFTPRLEDTFDLYKNLLLESDHVRRADDRAVRDQHRAGVAGRSEGRRRGGEPERCEAPARRRRDDTQVQKVIRPPTRTSLPITIADGRPSDEPMVVTALVTALLSNTLKRSTVGSKRVLPLLTLHASRRSTRFTHG